jgi:lipoate-protein ligase A
MAFGDVSGESPPEEWRLLPFDRGPSVRHIVQSDALVRSVNRPTVWWHAADAPALILGAGQKSEQIDEAAAAALGVQVVRRHAGGTSVFASTSVLGLDVALPTRHRLLDSDIVEAYRWLGQVWVSTLRSIGITTHLVSIAEARDAPPPDPVVAAGMRAACFGSISPYEVTVGGRKLVGLAQVRRRAGGLLSSGIHLDFDAETLARLLGGDAQLAAALHDAAIGLNEIARGSISTELLISAFNPTLETRLGVHLQPGDWTEEEETLVQESLHVT